MDFALLRSSGMPTYHMASCADDADLRISHIIRGQDHLTNTFKHILIFVALGAAPPRFAHLPLLIAPDGSMSDVGRTRTLPDGPVARWRMAVFSCANIGFGWFNAYAHAAEDAGFDLAIHTGDYFYEYAPGTYPDKPMEGRSLWPDHEAVTLADYRLRHAIYRADADLRRLHQLYPMVMVWDDHESANDSYADGAENHQSDSEGEWPVRKGPVWRVDVESDPRVRASRPVDGGNPVSPCRLLCGDGRSPGGERAERQRGVPAAIRRAVRIRARRTREPRPPLGGCM